MVTKHQAVIDLVKQISGQKNTLTLPRIFIKITGDTLAGIFLSEVVWSSDKSARTDGFFWKKAEDWKEELELSYAQVKRLATQLEEAGLIETRLMRAYGAPTMHYRPIMDAITKAILDFLENRQDENSTESKMESKESEESIDFRESEESITTPPTHNTTLEQAMPGADAPPSNLNGWLELIHSSKNRPATLRWMFETLYPGRDPPNYGYLGRTAKTVGGAGRLSSLLWLSQGYRVDGDVMRYCMGMAKGNGRKTNLDATIAAAEAFLEEIGEDGDTS